MTGRFARLRNDLSLRDEGVRVVDLCVELVVVVNGPLRPVMAQYQSIFDAFIARFGDRVRLCQGYDDKGMRPYRPEEWSEVERWLGIVSPESPTARGAHFQAGEPERSGEPPVFDALHLARLPELARSGLRIGVPIEVLDQNAEGFARWVATLIDDLHLTYAFCGPALCWNPEYPEVERLFRTRAVPKLLRHPGLGHGDLALFVLHADAGLVAVNWITAVSAVGLRRLGGSAALARALPAECVVTESRIGAAIIRAGQLPEIGDVNRQDHVPLYQAVARALGPLWCSEDYSRQINLMYFDEEAGHAWLRRFFR